MAKSGTEWLASSFKGFRLWQDQKTMLFCPSSVYHTLNFVWLLWTPFPWGSRLRWKIEPPTFNFAVENAIPTVRRTVSAEGRLHKTTVEPRGWFARSSTLLAHFPLRSITSSTAPSTETKFTSEYLPWVFHAVNDLDHGKRELYTPRNYVSRRIDGISGFSKNRMDNLKWLIVDWQSQESQIRDLIKFNCEQVLHELTRVSKYAQWLPLVIETVIILPKTKNRTVRNLGLF